MPAVKAKKTTARKTTATRKSTKARKSSKARVKAVTVTRKHCPGCKKTRPAASFWKNRSTADGLQPYCKGCYHVKFDKGGKAAAKRARMI